MVIKIAVLDDYLDTSEPYFNTLGPEYQVSYFKDTALPYGHPETPQQAKDALVSRLEPFQIISTYMQGLEKGSIKETSDDEVFDG